MFAGVNLEPMRAAISVEVSAIDASSLVRDNGRLKTFAIKGLGAKFWKVIQDALGNIDLSGISKDDFLDKVDDLYDSLIAPSIIAIKPLIGPLVNAALNQVVLNMASKFYDNHSGK